MNLMFSSHKKGPSEKALRKLAATPPPPLQGLLTLHVRRGDFNEHCYNLAHWGAVYNGFNSFPEFKDRFDISLPEDTPNNEREAIYLKHCYPSVEEIVSRVMDIKSSAKAQKKSIRRVYIMTNGSNEWVDELKAALWAATSDWEAGGVVSSRDLRLSWEEKFVAQILDMYVAERAQVFVGNGVSKPLYFFDGLSPLPCLNPITDPYVFTVLELDVERRHVTHGQRLGPSGYALLVMQVAKFIALADGIPIAVL